MLAIPQVLLRETAARGLEKVSIARTFGTQLALQRARTAVQSARNLVLVRLAGRQHLYQQAPDVGCHLALVERLQVFLHDLRGGLQDLRNVAGQALLELLLGEIEFLALVAVSDGALQEFFEIPVRLVVRENQFRFQRVNRFALDDLAEFEECDDPELQGGATDWHRRIAGFLDEHEHAFFLNDFRTGDRRRHHAGVAAILFERAPQRGARQPGVTERVSAARPRTETDLDTELQVVGNEDCGIPEAGHLRQRHTRTGPQELAWIDLHLLVEPRRIDSVIPFQRNADDPGNGCHCRGFA